MFPERGAEQIFSPPAQPPVTPSNSADVETGAQRTNRKYNHTGRQETKLSECCWFALRRAQRSFIVTKFIRKQREQHPLSFMCRKYSTLLVTTSVVWTWANTCLKDQLTITMKLVICTHNAIISDTTTVIAPSLAITRWGLDLINISWELCNSSCDTDLSHLLCLCGIPLPCSNIFRRRKTVWRDSCLIRDAITWTKSFG